MIPIQATPPHDVLLVGAFPDTCLLEVVQVELLHVLLNVHHLLVGEGFVDLVLEVVSHVQISGLIQMRVLEGLLQVVDRLGVGDGGEQTETDKEQQWGKLEEQSETAGMSR